MRATAAFAGLVVFVASTSAFAQDIPTTTEFGITITSDNLTDAIQETQDFWGPVRKHIAATQLGGADAKARQEAAAFLKQVHDALHHQLFDSDDATAQDLLQYLAQRLRKFELYRQFRTAVGNDAIVAALVERWERAQRDINGLPAAQQAAARQAALASMREAMQAAPVSADASEKAMTILTMQNECIMKMNATQAGKIVLGYEQQARQRDPAVRDLLHAVAAAADWAQITKTGAKPLGRQDFVHAWDELAQLKGSGRTAHK